MKCRDESHGLSETKADRVGDSVHSRIAAGYAPAVTEDALVGRDPILVSSLT